MIFRVLKWEPQELVKEVNQSESATETFAVHFVPALRPIYEQHTAYCVLKTDLCPLTPIPCFSFFLIPVSCLPALRFRQCINKVINAQQTSIFKRVID